MSLRRVIMSCHYVMSLRHDHCHCSSSPGPPGPVSNISSTLAGLTAVKVSWLPRDGEIMNIISYSVEVTCRGRSFNFSNDTNNPNVTIEELPYDTTCDVNISATNNNGTGPVATSSFDTASRGGRMFV